MFEPKRVKFEDEINLNAAPSRRGQLDKLLIERVMHGHEKSDFAIVAVKPASRARLPSTQS